MSLVRRGGRSYFYKSVRKNGRVTSVYYGRAHFAELAAEIEACEREEARLVRLAEKLWREQFATEDAPVAEMFHAVEAITRASLMTAGYHQHRRSEWRKRSVKIVAPKPAEKVAAANAALPGPDITLPELFERATEGDPKVRLRLRALIERGVVRIPEYEAAAIAEVTSAQVGHGANLLVQEVQIRELRRTAMELAGPDPSPLERLLAHRVAVCQQALHRAEAQLAVQTNKGVSADRVEFLDRRVDGAHRRFLQAAKMLATVRRLGATGPAVQVSVSQTVNVEAKGEESTPRLDVPTLMRCPPRG